VLSAVTSKAFVGVVERAGALIIVLDIEEAVPLGARAALTVDTEREGRQLGA
jgi:hypothetical protein